MEIGDEAVEDAEAARRVEEDAGAAGFDGRQGREGGRRFGIGDIAPSGAVEAAGDGFEDPCGGGPDGDDAASLGFGVVDGLGGGCGEGEPFLVHAVVGDVVALDREEGAGADVEGEVGSLNPGVGELLEEFRGEMESGGGSGDGSGLAGVDGLVAMAILGGGRSLGAMDVGREGDFAMDFGEGEHVGFELEEAMTFRVFIDHDRRKRVGKVGLGGVEEEA